MNKLLLLTLLSALLPAAGCLTPYQHATGVQQNNNGGLTAGTVQREIRVGMSGAEVIEAMGSPNIVTTDAERREVWTYDKFATDTVRSSSEGGIASLFFNSPIALLGVGNVQTSSGATSKSQRTLTVIIKFDENALVRDFAYHASRF